MRQVTFEEGQQFAEQNDLMFIETSAVLNSNVIDAFQMLVESKYKYSLYNYLNFSEIHMSIMEDIDDKLASGKLSERSLVRL